MDTASHFVVGVGLAGLSQLDPVALSDPSLHTAVILATIVGSQAPDFDTVTRLHNNETYIRQHRGISHSIPAVIIWTLLISTLLYKFLHLSNGYWHLLGWTFFAVSLHVGMDLFNTYGTQALRPFSKIWVSWNIIHIFDPFIFITHVIAGVLWISNWVKPSIIFPVLYVLIAGYYVTRVLYHHSLLRYLKKKLLISKHDQLMIIPTVKYRIWHVMLKLQDESYRVGSWKNRELKWVETVTSDFHPLIDKSHSHPSVAALLNFTNYTVSHVIEHQWGTEVRWCDVRYRYRKQYPFVAIVFYDHNEQAVASYVGWLNDKKLYKRLYTEAKLSPS